MKEIRNGDTIEVPNGADHIRQARYVLRVTEVPIPYDHDGTTGVRGVVVNADGSIRRNRKGNIFERATTVVTERCVLVSRAYGPGEVVDTEFVDCDGAPICIGQRVTCVGPTPSVMTGRQAVVVGTERWWLLLDMVRGDVSTGAAPVKRSPDQVRVRPAVAVLDELHGQAIVENAERDHAAGWRRDRTGRRYQVTIRPHETTPGVVIETCRETWIEEIAVLPGTHPRGPVKTGVGDRSQAEIRTWRRVVRGVLYSFEAVTMPNGQRRYFAKRHSGYRDLRFSCAWELAHAIIVEPAQWVVTIEIGSTMFEDVWQTATADMVPAAGDPAQLAQDVADNQDVVVDEQRARVRVFEHLGFGGPDRKLLAEVEIPAVEVVDGGASGRSVWIESSGHRHLLTIPPAPTDEPRCDGCDEPESLLAIGAVADGCSHGVDCQTHPRVGGVHNYDRAPNGDPRPLRALPRPVPPAGVPADVRDDAVTAMVDAGVARVTAFLAATALMLRLLPEPAETFLRPTLTAGQVAGYRAQVQVPGPPHPPYRRAS